MGKLVILLNVILALKKHHATAMLEQYCSYTPIHMRTYFAVLTCYVMQTFHGFDTTKNGISLCMAGFTHPNERLDSTAATLNPNMTIVSYICQCLSTIQITAPINRQKQSLPMQITVDKFRNLGRYFCIMHYHGPVVKLIKNHTLLVISASMW